MRCYQLVTFSDRYRLQDAYLFLVQICNDFGMLCIKVQSTFTLLQSNLLVYIHRFSCFTLLPPKNSRKLCIASHFKAFFIPKELFNSPNHYIALTESLHRNSPNHYIASPNHYIASPNHYIALPESLHRKSLQPFKYVVCSDPFIFSYL